MNNYKVAYRIMACYDRKHIVEEELKKLQNSNSGVDVKVFYDDRLKENRKGTYYTQLKCINDVLDNKSYTHLVLLQDDILLCNDFDKCIQELINYKPYDLWTLFCPRIKNYDVSTDEPYAQIYPANTWGQGNLIEINMLKEIIKFREEKIPNYIYDDGLYLMYCIENNLPVYTTRVGLLQHLCPTKSTLGYNNKNKITKLWIGEDVYHKVNWKSRKFKKYNLPTSADIQKEYAKYGKK